MLIISHLLRRNHLFLLLLLFTLHWSCTGQPEMKSGTVVYEVIDSTENGQKKTQMILHFQGEMADRQKTEEDQSGLNRNILFFDRDTVYTVYYDYEDDGIFVHAFPFSHFLPRSKGKTFTVRTLEEKRTILGLECHKFKSEPVDTTQILTVSIEGWVTDQIKSRAKPIGLEFEPYIPGFPLEMTVTRSTYKHRNTETFRAISVTPSVPDSAFRIPREGIPHLEKHEMAFPIQLSGNWFFEENDIELGWTVLKDRVTGATIQIEDAEPLDSDDSLGQEMEIETESAGRLYKVPKPAIEQVTFQGRKALQSRFCHGAAGKMNCVLIRKFVRFGKTCTVKIQSAERYFQNTLDSALPMLESIENIKK